MHFSSAFLVFGIHGLNPLNGDSHHGLVSNLARQFLVAHTGYMQVGLAAIDSCVVRRRGIAKRFRKAADFRPPLQRFRRVSSRKNRDRALNDRFHDRSITEYIRVAYIHAAATTDFPSPHRDASRSKNGNQIHHKWAQTGRCRHRELKIGRHAAYRHAVQRVLATVKRNYESGQYRSTTEAEYMLRKLVEQDQTCA